MISTVKNEKAEKGAARCEGDSAILESGRVSLGRKPLNKYLKGMTFNLKEAREGAYMSVYEGTAFQAGHSNVCKGKGLEVGESGRFPETSMTFLVLIAAHPGDRRWPPGQRN